MGNRLRKLGIIGKNLPTKKALTVKASDFLIGGIIGKFDRQYKTALLCYNIDDFREKFGDQTISSWYGWDVVKGFFDNVVGTDAKLYVKSHVGHTVSAFDGVAATLNCADLDGTPESIIQVDHAYEGTLCYGVAGNRIGITITAADRFTTACNGSQDTANAYVVVDSVAGVRVGDTIKIAHTSAIYREVTSIDETNKKILFTVALGATVADDVAVTVMGFQIKTWKKDVNGIVSEVDKDLGKVICTIGSAVTDFYFVNVFSSSKYLKLTKLTTVTIDPEKKFPAAIATVTYLASGVDGTGTTSTANIWASDLTALTNLPVRFIANAECTAQVINEAGEVYCKGREDTPKWIYNIPKDRTKAQLVAIGNAYQRSDDVLGVITANWLDVTDPFASSSFSPYRGIPNVGHILGNWIRSIGLNGIHMIPAIMSNPLYGIQGIVGDTFLSGDDRTEIAEAGVNLIQQITGSGYIVRNFFTPSTTLEFSFANGILMRSYMFVSVADSLANTENEPNNYARIKSSKMAILNFYYALWERGSTGSVPEGETFGQSINADGSSTKAEDHFQVQADLINNPQASINAGERNLDSWFTYPAPAGSIQIGVGFILR